MMHHTVRRSVIGDIVYCKSHDEDKMEEVNKIIRGDNMEKTIKKFKAILKMKLASTLDVEIFFDTDMEPLFKEGNGAGEKYIICAVRFYEHICDEYNERHYYFPIETKFSSLKDLFINELWLITSKWRKYSLFDTVTDSNPELAWLFYKKTFDKVMRGEEIWKNSYFTAELICEFPDGKNITLKHLEDDTERLFLDEEYLGRVDVCPGDEHGIIYCGIDSEEGIPFLCDTKTQKKYEGAIYKPFFGSKTLLMESGIQIHHTGSLHEIGEGMKLAVTEFISRRNK